MEFKFDFEKMLEVLKLLPRKIIGGVVLAWLICYYAQQGVDWKVLVIAAVIGITSIASHWNLEAKNPTQEKPTNGEPELP